MATKDKLVRLLQDARLRAEINRRPAAPQNSPLFLWQLRNHLTEANRPRHRLLVTVDIEEAADFPQPVKITHLKTGTGV